MLFSYSTFILTLSVSIATAYYECLCNYHVDLAIYPVMNSTFGRIGSMKEFDCLPTYKNSTTFTRNWQAIQYHRQVGFVFLDSETKLQTCMGNLTQSKVEVGVNLQSNFMIQYTFNKTHVLPATDLVYIRVGFITKKKQGILLQIRDETNTEYVSLEINNNGGVKFFLDVGFERWELNTDLHNVDLTNGQAHEVIMRRENRGRDVYLQVDNYPAAIGRLGNRLSDSILDSYKYLFIGNNDTANTWKGFDGCIYSMQIDNMFPLKRAFQDPRPDYIRINGPVREDVCNSLKPVAVSEAHFLNCPWVSGLDCSLYSQRLECGTDRTTYSNRCLFAKARCQDLSLHILHDGSCATPPATTPNPYLVDGGEAVLDFFCMSLSHTDCDPNDVSLVCGRDGRTYPNYCEYEKARCTHRNLHVANFGHCAS